MAVIYIQLSIRVDRPLTADLSLDKVMLQDVIKKKL